MGQDTALASLRRIRCRTFTEFPSVVFYEVDRPWPPCTCDTSFGQVRAADCSKPCWPTQNIDAVQIPPAVTRQSRCLRECCGPWPRDEDDDDDDDDDEEEEMTISS